MTVDPKKELDGFRARAGVFRILDLPEVAYLAVDGRGDPNTSAQYSQGVAALYAVAYRLGSSSRRERRVRIGRRCGR